MYSFNILYIRYYVFITKSEEINFGCPMLKDHKYFCLIPNPGKLSDWNSFRVNQSYSDICIRANANHSKPIRKTFCISFDEKGWRINPINSVTSLRMNPKLSFQSRSIRSRIDPNRIFNQNQSESCRPWIHSDRFWLKIWIDLDWKLAFGLVRIHSDWCLGIKRINSDWFLTVFHHTRYKTFFGLVWNDSLWLGYRYRNESE